MYIANKLSVSTLNFFQVYCTFDLLRFAVNVCCAICDHLNIHCFSIKPVLSSTASATTENGSNHSHLSEEHISGHRHWTLILWHHNVLGTLVWCIPCTYQRVITFELNGVVYIAVIMCIYVYFNLNVMLCGLLGAVVMHFLFRCKALQWLMQLWNVF